MFAVLVNYSSAASSSELLEVAKNASINKTGFAVQAAAGPFVIAINFLLYCVFTFFGLIMLIAGILFDWAINPTNFTAVMNMNAIYTSWLIVRDTLNLFFIFVLLFSGFCTIFQVEKYHIKKVLLTVILMALLVNFSFPIARIIIDSGNLMMYFILNKAFPNLSETSGISANLAQFAQIINSIVPKPEFFNIFSENNWSSPILTMKIIASSVFLFLFAMTLLIIAMLFIIRIVVLAILIIFSPVAFTGAILPNFSKYADKWWTTLFQQTFWGPIMAFMLYLALKIMQEMQNGEIAGSLTKIVTDNSTGKEISQLIVAGTTLAIPLAILWIGVGMAKTMEAYGADMATKYARKGMNWAGSLPWKGFKATGIPGGFKQGAEYYKKKGAPGFLGKIPGLRGSEKTQDAESRIANSLTGGRAGLSARGVINKRAADRADELKKMNISAKDAMDNMMKGDAVERLANAMYMLDKDMITDSAKLRAVLDAAGNDNDLKLKIINKLPKGIINKVDDAAELGEIIEKAKHGLEKDDADKIEENIKGKFREEKKVSVLMDYDINIAGKSSDKVFEKYLKNMSGEDLGKQKGMHNEKYLKSIPGLIKYLSDKDNTYKVKAFSEMSDEGMKAWKNANIH